MSTVRIEPNRGAGFRVSAGSTVKFTQVGGPQVIDLNLLSVADPREHFWAGRTRTIEGMHLSVGSALWSVEPWMRPLATVVGDTTQGFATERGARYHDVNYPRCSRRSHDMRCDVAEHRTCHDNLVEALGDLGLDRALVHDTLNLFMLTGLDAPSDDLFVEPTQTSEEDYFELRAEDDCYVVASACPGHSNSGNHPVLIEVSD